MDQNAFITYCILFTAYLLFYANKEGSKQTNKSKNLIFLSSYRPYIWQTDIASTTMRLRKCENVIFFFFFNFMYVTQCVLFGLGHLEWRAGRKASESAVCLWGILRPVLPRCDATGFLPLRSPPQQDLPHLKRTAHLINPVFTVPTCHSISGRKTNRRPPSCTKATFSHTTSAASSSPTGSSLMVIYN